jgi:hypothetical protein
MKMRRGHLKTPLIFYRGQQTPSCQETMGPATECSDIEGSNTISTWIPSLLLRRVESLPEDTAAFQLFVTDKGFVYVVPMKRKGEVLLAMKQFAKEIGAHDAFVADMSGEQMSKEVKAFCHEIESTLRALEEGTPWANKAELYIGLLKEAVRKDMKDQDSPIVFWDYKIERRARIHNLTAKSNFKLHGSNPYTLTVGEEGDISNPCHFAWYKWCYYREHTTRLSQPTGSPGESAWTSKGRSQRNVPMGVEGQWNGCP